MNGGGVCTSWRGWAPTAALASALLAASLQAQGVQAIKVDDLRPAAPPAFILLGVAPTLVERPTSPQALAVSLLSATAEEDLLPREYALEVAPFWLARHPTLSYEDYYTPTFFQGVVQSLAISLATTALGDTADAGTALGIGARTFLVSGRPHPELATLELRLRTIQDSMNHVTLFVEPALEDSIARLSPQPDDPDRLLDSLLAEQLRSLERTAAEVALAMQELDKERVGWQVEMATAVVLDYAASATDSGRVGRVGAWLTVAHRLAGSGLDLVAVARYRHDRRTTPARNLLDFGGRFAWEGEDVTLSGEFLEYAGDDAPGGEAPGYRLGVNLEYRLGDWGSVTATVAKDDPLDGVGSPRLITSLGLNLGFGTLPMIVGGT